LATKKPRARLRRRTSKKKALQKKFKWPAAFKVVPIPIPRRRKTRARVLGATAESPCPSGCYFVMQTRIGGILFNVCLCDGIYIFIQV